MMIALAFGLALVAACSGKGKKTTTNGDNHMLAKKVSLAWGFQVEGDQTDVFLAATDETGKQVSHPVGKFPGACSKITTPKEMTALIAVGCKVGGTGIELHAVVQDNQIVIMKMTATPDGATPDPMAREEVARVGVPLGAAIEAAP